MKIRLTPRAFADREDIFDYLQQKSPAGAQSVMARFRAAIERLADQAHSGVKTDVADIRVLFRRALSLQSVLSSSGGDHRNPPHPAHVSPAGRSGVRPRPRVEAPRPMTTNGVDNRL